MSTNPHPKKSLKNIDYINIFIRKLTVRTIKITQITQIIGKRIKYRVWICTHFRMNLIHATTNGHKK